MSEPVFRTPQDFAAQHPELAAESKRRDDEAAKQLHDEKVQRRNQRRLTDRIKHQRTLASLSSKLNDVLHALEQYPSDLKNSDCPHVKKIREQANQILSLLSMLKPFELEPKFIAPRAHKIPYGYVYDASVEHWRREDV